MTRRFVSVGAKEGGAKGFVFGLMTGLASAVALPVLGAGPFLPFAAEPRRWARSEPADCRRRMRSALAWIIQHAEGDYLKVQRETMGRQD